MNTDRLLTRVFDKQEKKMISFCGDPHFNITGKEMDGTQFTHEYSFISCTNECIVAFCMCDFNRGKNTLVTIPFGDRFIPMQCSGLSNKNKKLIYEGDILRVQSKDDWEKINFASYEVFLFDDDSRDGHIGFRMSRVHYHGSISGGYVPNFNPQTTSRMETIGNKFENPELMEKNL